ncbi:AAA family ATPase [Coleofasciculus sp. H7-2]|uniref:AAA family ATPase n=1 Tax=Coleofasciculus sp. H7-2 TaxID=3351545 RepID=UPI003672670A
MKVKRLKMTSFRGISDMTLDFQTDEPNVLIGINGVGKSSILDCLAILLYGFVASIRFPSSTERLFSDQDITNTHQETHKEITIQLDWQQVTWSLTSVRTGSSKKASSELSQLPALVDNIRQQLETNSNANIPLAVYYGVDRTVIETPLEIFPEAYFKPIDAYEQAITLKQINFSNFFQWFRALEDVENEERRDNPDYRDRQLEAVRLAIASVAPDFSKLRVRRSPLRMTVTKQGQELTVNQLSDGEKCLLAMVGDLAIRLAIANPSLENPLQGEGVVLIDEIELHLHPKWQRKIIPALTRTFPNCQFIVTTHSPQVISEVKPNGIYILEATSLRQGSVTTEGVVAKRPESSYGRDSNRILEDLMDTPARPQEIKDHLLELFRLIDKGDLDGARQLRQQIVDEIGESEPELVKASVSIRRKEILSR